MITGQTVHPSPDERVTCLRSAADGGPFVFELELGPRAKGPPRHSHDEGDEVVEVIRGRIEFEINGQWRCLDAGQKLTLTPSDVHTFRNPSRDEPVVCRVTHGARFERLIEKTDLLELARFLTREDPGASRVASPFLRGALRVLAWLAPAGASGRSSSPG